MSNDGAASDPKSCVTFLVALPAIRLAFGPADAVGAAVRKDLDPNLSAVYENVRSRAYFQRVLETGLEYRHRDLSVRYVSFGRRLCPRPPIVRDESSRVFLGVALQQTPPLRRPPSIVSQV